MRIFLMEIGKIYNLKVFNDGRACNVVGSRYVDFQGFHLPETYTEDLKARLNGVANVGKWGPWMNYHPIPELNIGGGRNNTISAYYGFSTISGGYCNTNLLDYSVIGGGITNTSSGYFVTIGGGQNNTSIGAIVQQLVVEQVIQ